MTKPIFQADEPIAVDSQGRIVNLGALASNTTPEHIDPRAGAIAGHQPKPRRRRTPTNGAIKP